MARIGGESAFGRSAGRVLPFSESLERLEDVPEAFRARIGARFGATPPRAMIHTPRFETFGLTVPESLLALGEGFWWAAFAENGGPLQVREARCAATRLIEVSQLLLHGELRLDGGEATESCVIAFNMVGADLFRLFVQMVLAEFPAGGREARRAGTEPDLSFKLRSALQESLPGGEAELADIAGWPPTGAAVRGDPLHPAGVLAVVPRCVCLVLETAPPKAGQAPNRLDHWGKVVTYLNRGFPLAWTLTPTAQGSELNLMVGQGRAACVRVVMPPGAAAGIERILSTIEGAAAPVA